MCVLLSAWIPISDTPMHACTTINYQHNTTGAASTHCNSPDGVERMAWCGVIKGWADSRCDNISLACLVSHLSFSLSLSSSCLLRNALCALPACPVFIVCMGHKLWSKALLNALCWSPFSPLILLWRLRSSWWPAASLMLMCLPHDFNN